MTTIGINLFVLFFSLTVAADLAARLDPGEVAVPVADLHIKSFQLENEESFGAIRRRQSVNYELLHDGKECPDKQKITVSKKVSEPAVCAALVQARSDCDGLYFELRKDRKSCRCNRKGTPCDIRNDGGTVLYKLLTAIVELGGENDASAVNLEACIGECDHDGQCKAGLVCFQRTGFTPVPGCSGQGKQDWDYCYDPTGSIELSGGNDPAPTYLQACTGECDDDSQCAPGLKCFQRENGETIPGCKGSGFAKNWDYCYDPSWVAGHAPRVITTCENSREVQLACIEQLWDTNTCFELKSKTLIDFDSWREAMFQDLDLLKCHACPDKVFAEFQEECMEDEELPPACPCKSGDFSRGYECYPKCPKGHARTLYNPTCLRIGCPNGMIEADGLEQGNFAICRHPSNGEAYSLGDKGYPWKFGDWAFDYKPALARCKRDHKGNCELLGLIAYPRCKQGYKRVALHCWPEKPNCHKLGMTKTGDDWSCQKRPLDNNRPAYWPCAQNRDHQERAFKEVKIKPAFDFCWRDGSGKKVPRGWVECGGGASTTTPVCVDKIFAQVGAVATFAGNLITLGTTNAVQSVVKVAKNVKDTVDNINAVRSQVSDYTNMIQWTLEAKTSPATAGQFQKVDLKNGMVKPDLDTQMGREVFAIQTAGLVTDLLELADPFGVMTVVSEFMYPKCSIVKGLEF